MVLRRVEARHELGAPGARWDRLHVGARPPLLHEARPARPAHVRRRRVPPRPAHVAVAPTRRSRRERRLAVKFDEPPDDVEWNPWGPAVRVEIEQGSVMLFARAVKDDSAVYASVRAARSAGFARVPVPPTFTFVMAGAGAFPDIQPEGGTGSMFATAGADGDAASAFSRDGLFLHGEQHFTYHRAVS